MIDISIDTEEVLNKISKLDIKKQRKVFIDGAKKAGSIIPKEYKKTVKSNLKSKSYTALFRGVGVKEVKGKLSVKITIRSRQKNSKAYILTFFELGTTYRFAKYKNKKRKKLLKKKRYTGRVASRRWFTNATERKEAEVFNSLEGYLKEAFIKIWNKR
jgi:hypothetical protein